MGLILIQSAGQMIDSSTTRQEIEMNRKFSSLVRSVASITIGLCASASMAQHQASMQIAGSQLQHTMLEQVKHGQHVRVERMPIPDGFVDLELERISVLTSDAQLVVGTENGFEDLERPDVVVLSGVVAGTDSLAYLAISPYGTNGFIDLNGELISISTGPYAQDQDLRDKLRSAWMSDLVDPNNAPEVCGYTQGDAALEPAGQPIEFAPMPLQDGDSNARGSSTCRIAGIAIETDWEFTDRLFNGDTNASAAYAVSLIGAISEIYNRDVEVRLAIPYLRVWASDSDPYSPAAGDPLDQVRAFWNANMGSVERTVVHYLTGRRDTSYGGVAYVSVLCNESFGYGVSAYLNGSFPYPLQDNRGGNWDVVVVSHELGHNFGTGHTHSYSPPIDECGNGDCSDPFGGTIMSYCHSCTGGIANIVLGFHPRVQSTIEGYIDSIGCDLIGEGVNAVPDSMQTVEGVAIDIDAISNDQLQSCDEVSLVGVDSMSTQGGIVELLEGQGPVGRDLFRYTPLEGFEGIDTFEYTITGLGGSQTTSVTVDVRALRAADARINPIPGLSVKYYQLESPQVLPDFDSLSPFATDVSTDVTYPSTSGNFMNSGLSDDVGAVIEGYVNVFFDGIYTLTTNSDDGSRLYIGDELVVDNDGLHGMVKRAGTIPLSAGWHKVRIEFFERGGGAGLMATIIWPTSEEIELAGSFISHESTPQCSPADMNADGDINFLDISAFLAAFDEQTSAGDFNGNGAWDFFDIADFLGAVQAGCP
jgi:Metallo-peptidase family M12/PA14 domain/Bacterial Ig domain